MTVIDTISGFFKELQDDMAGELKAIEAYLRKADTKSEEYKTLGDLLQTHKDIQSMPFLQPSSTLTIKDLGNAAAVVDWYLKVMDKHYQNLVKHNTIPSEISNLGLARQLLSDWARKVITWMNAEEKSINLYPVSNVAENLFLCVMDQIYPKGSTGKEPAVVKQTERLFKRGHLTLSDRQIEELTKSWDKVLTFVTDPSAYTSIPLTCSCLTTAVADLITLHSLLEELYDRLESNVTRSDEDVFSLE
jgi:hypothetical protein